MRRLHLLPLIFAAIIAGPRPSSAAQLSGPKSTKKTAHQAATRIVEQLEQQTGRTIDPAARKAHIEKGARIIGDLHQSMERFFAEEKLVDGAKRLVEAGKRPGLITRIKLKALLNDRTGRLASASAAYGQELEEFKRSGSLYGGDLRHALEEAQEVERVLGVGSEEERAHARAAVHTAIFNRVTREIGDLAGSGVSLRSGLGQERLARLRFLIDAIFDGGRGALKRFYTKAATDGVELDYARWARADRELRELDQAKAEREPRVVNAEHTARRASREPKDQMGDLPPSELLGKLDRGELGEWKGALKPEHGSWESQVARGLKLSFGRYYERQLGRIRTELGYGNPLTAHVALEMLSDLKSHLQQAQAIGVTMEGPGETRARLRADLTGPTPMIDQLETTARELTAKAAGLEASK
jgi:hypothetical protein